MQLSPQVARAYALVGMLYFYALAWMRVDARGCAVRAAVRAVDEGGGGVRTRKINPGNTGHRGYKMQRIERFTEGDGKHLIAHLVCGHQSAWPIYVPFDEPLEKVRARDLAEYSEKYGGTRQRCNQCGGSGGDAA